MSDNFTPIGNKVIIKVHEAEKVTSGGIIIPDKAKDAPTVGVIISINAKTAEEYNCCAGDEILFGRHTTINTKINDMELQILEIDKAYGIFKND